MVLQYDKKLKIFPYIYKIIISYTLTDTYLDISINFKNKDSVDIALAPGFHPYFRVPSFRANSVMFEDAKVQDRYEDELSVFAEGGTIFNDMGKQVAFLIDTVGEMELSASDNLKRLWIRKEESKDFLCVEPVRGDPAAILHDPVVVKPGEEVSFQLKIAYKKSR